MDKLKNLVSQVSNFTLSPLSALIKKVIGYGASVGGIILILNIFFGVKFKSQGQVTTSMLTPIMGLITFTVNELAKLNFIEGPARQIKKDLDELTQHNHALRLKEACNEFSPLESSYQKILTLIQQQTSAKDLSSVENNIATLLATTPFNLNKPTKKEKFLTLATATLDLSAHTISSANAILLYYIIPMLFKAGSSTSTDGCIEETNPSQTLGIIAMVSAMIIMLYSGVESIAHSHKDWSTRQQDREGLISSINQFCHLFHRISGSDPAFNASPIKPLVDNWIANTA